MAFGKTFCALVAMVVVAHADLIPGSDQMGRAYNLNYYASSRGVDISKERVFIDSPDEADSCVGYALPSDVSCNELATGVAEGYKIYSSQSQSTSANQQIGVGLEVKSFSSTTEHSYSSDYYYTTNFASTSAFGQYYYYELDFMWEKRGLSSAFLDDLNNNNIDTCTIAEKYGYYFLVSGYYGGDYLYTQSQSYASSNSSSTMETSISNSFAGFTSSVDFGQTTTGSSTTSYSEFRFTYNGCDYQCLRNGAACTWIDSCRDKPTLFAFSENTPSLIDLTTLLDGYGQSTRAEESVACIDAYLNSLGVQEFGHVQLTSDVTFANVTNLPVPPKWAYYPKCPVLDYNHILTDITFMTSYVKDHPEYGAQVVGMTCTYTMLDVPNPGSASSYETVITSGGESYPTGGSSVISSHVPPNSAIVGVGVLAGEGCTRSYGVRLYYSELDLKSISPPYIATLDLGRYVDVLWTQGYCYTLCASAKAPVSSIETKSFWTFNDKDGDSSNEFRVSFHSLSRYGTNDTIYQTLEFGPVGGLGGSTWRDPFVGGTQRISEVTVCYDSSIRSIQVTYEDSSGAIQANPQHGSGGDTCSTTVIDKNEYVTGIQGTAGLYVDSLGIITNVQEYPVYGGGGSPYYLTTTGMVLSLFGRVGDAMDAVGIYVNETLHS